MFEAEDIEVFILTYNRAEFLKQCLGSIIGQSIKGFGITVLDNSSSDNTMEVVRSFGIKYVKTEPRGDISANYKMAQQLAKRKYAMAFHDDDILHPEYIETVLRALNKVRDVNLLLSCFTFFEGNTPPEFERDMRPYCYLLKGDCELAVYMYARGGVSYSGAVYKTEIFKNIKSDLDVYGKNNDWPILLQAAQNKNVLLLKDRLGIFARRHKGQDTTNPSTGISIKQLLNWEKLYYQKCNTTHAGGKVFTSRIYRDIKAKYDGWTSSSERKSCPWPQLVDKASAMGLISPVALRCGIRKHSLYARMRTFWYRNTAKYSPREIHL